MTGPDPADVQAAVADAHRREWGFVLAATVRVAGSIDLAEECVQDAYGAALDAWRHQGVPRSPGAWLTTAARRRALDVLRREQTLRRKLPLIVEPAVAAGADESLLDRDDDVIEDERLRLVFTCCHPALAREAQVALTLRLLCGLTTAEIAAAFLVPEATMAARVTRAKKKITAAGIPYRVPGTAELPERLDAVLTVVHLVFTTGHTAPSGDVLVRSDLVDRALELGRLLRGADARRARGARPAGADAAHRLAPRDPAGRRRPAGAARRPGPRPLGPRRGARGAGPGPRPAPEPGRALRGAGRDRRRARAGAVVRRDPVGPGRAALRRAAAGVAVAGRRAQPCGRPGRGRRSGGGARRGGPAGRRGPARGLPVPAGDPGATCCAGWAGRRRRRRRTTTRWPWPTTTPSARSSPPAGTTPAGPERAGDRSDRAARERGYPGVRVSPVRRRHLRPERGGSVVVGQ